jgi:Tfp pilus assembly protein PilF
LENLDKAVSHNPKDQMAWMQRGIAYLESKKYPEALENFQQAITLEPQENGGYFYAAITLRSMGMSLLQ